VTCRVTRLGNITDPIRLPAATTMEVVAAVPRYRIVRWEFSDRRQRQV